MRKSNVKSNLLSRLKNKRNPSDYNISRLGFWLQIEELKEIGTLLFLRLYFGTVQQ
jgi:hypothetical protein